VSGHDAGLCDANEVTMGWTMVVGQCDALPIMPCCQPSGWSFSSSSVDQLRPKKTAAAVARSGRFWYSLPPLQSLKDIAALVV
jgi:hypothetical protein